MSTALSSGPDPQHTPSKALLSLTSFSRVVGAEKGRLEESDLLIKCPPLVCLRDPVPIVTHAWNHYCILTGLSSYICRLNHCHQSERITFPSSIPN